jgi:hypothetical protein
LVQHVGQTMDPTDLLALVRPPQTPNSPTAIQPSTSGEQSLPLTQDPDTMRRAAMLAKLLGIPQGAGGSIGGAGSGGLPLGYG